MIETLRHFHMKVSFLWQKNNKKENKQKARIARKLIMCYDIHIAMRGEKI